MSDKTFSIFHTCWRKGVDVFYRSQRFSELPLLLGDNSKNCVLPKRRANTVQSSIKDIGGFAMSYEDTEKICKKNMKKGMTVSQF